MSTLFENVKPGDKFINAAGNVVIYAGTVKNSNMMVTEDHSMAYMCDNEGISETFGDLINLPELDIIKKDNH